MSTRSPVTCCEAGADRGALAPVLSACVTIFVVLSPQLREHLPRAVVAAVVDDDELAVDGQVDRTHAPQDLDDRVALVEDRHDHRELAVRLDGGRPMSGTGAPCAPGSRCRSCPRSFGTSRNVRIRPSAAGPRAPSPSTSRASVMSGWRWVGSSVGSGSNTISDDEPVTSSTAWASSRIVNSFGLPMLTGPTWSDRRSPRMPRIRSST